MRHLELPIKLESEVKSECNIEIKDEDLEEFDIKEDLMELPLDVELESVVDFDTYDRRDLVTEQEILEGEASLSYSGLKLIPLGKQRNRRKALQPQRASITALNLELDSYQLEQSTDNIDESFENELEEGEDDREVDNDQNIFKGLQEEADGEEIDTAMQRSVREEWKSHWGVKCNMCDSVFTLKSQFDKHYRTNYNTNPIYTCSYCSKTMDKYSTFRSHCYRHITEGRYKCDTCNKGFSLQSMLHIHITAKHTEKKPFVCEECGKGFVTKPGLKVHMKKHKNDVKEEFPCLECGKVLHTRGGLTAHMNVHRMGRRFMCDLCGKTFTQKVNMQQHVKHHNGERPHSCDKCGKSFAEKSHLARHYSFHSEQRPYKCDVCQKMYKTERCLKVHSMVHSSSRPYVCSYCNKGFLSSTKLKQHFNIHTGERPYKCKYCERTFTNYPNWLKHTRRRHKVDHKTGDNLRLDNAVAKEEPTIIVPPHIPSTYYIPFEQQHLDSFLETTVDIGNSNIVLPPFTQQFVPLDTTINFHDPNMTLPHMIQVQVPQMQL